jgi:hypothetical protein
MEAGECPSKNEIRSAPLLGGLVFFIDIPFIYNSFIL